MLPRPRSVAASVLLVLCLAPVPAFGQTLSTAEELFRQARKLYDDGKYEEACEKFDASYNVDPSTGTLLNLARCNEQIGKTATAWGQYLTAARLSRKEGFEARERVAQKRASKLEAQLVRLEIVVPEAVRVDGLEVYRDGVKQVDATWGTGIPVDPGEHEVRATAPGKKPFIATVVVDVEAGETKSFELPTLEDAPEPVEPPPVTPAVPPGDGKDDDDDPRPPPPPRDEGLGTQRIVALTLGGVGLAGILVGTGFGVKALNDWGDVKDLCPNNECPSNEVLQTRQSGTDDATSAANISTASFAAGGALLALGTVLFFTAPSSPDPAVDSGSRSAPRVGALRQMKLHPVVGAGEGGLFLSGRF